jgi:hypothetical protein
MAAGVTVTRTGNPKAKVRGVLDRYGKRVVDGHVAAANVLINASLQIVPRDEGILAASANITQDGEGISAVVYAGYGLRQRLGKVLRGPEFKPFVSFKQPNPSRVPANYAWRQHFNLTLKHPNGGRAHYLTEPSKTKIPKMRQAFRQAFREGK